MSVRDILRDIPVECPYCRKENTTSFEPIDLRAPIQCVKCKKSFVIGDIFELLYEEEPLARESIDTIVRYATSKWVLKEGSQEASGETQEFLQRIGFEDLIKRTATQVLVHGDAFLKTMASGGKTASWELLPTKQVQVKTSKIIERGAITSVLKEDEFILTVENEEHSFGPDEIIHFKKALLNYDKPYGDSMLQITLNPFNFLRRLRQAPQHIQSQFKGLQQMYKEEVLLGLGVPKFVLERRAAGLDTRLAKYILITFVEKIRILQELLSEGFDRAIGQFASQGKLTEVPKIQLRKLTERMVLLDCDFSFATEIESWKKLYDVGIITKEELDANLKEFEQ